MDIKTVYEKHKNLKLAAAELGMKWQTLYVHLKRIGVPVTGDKLRYGSDKDRLAAKAELEFNRLVPFAVSQNHLKFQAKFDYLVGGQKVDIKASSLARGNRRYEAVRWAFSVKRQEFCADYVVCFGLMDDGYRLFLIPGELLRHYMSISVAPNGKSKWLQYEISQDDLTEFFDSIR